MRNVRFTWEQRLGKIGESEIQSRLSYCSTVNKIEVDVGIDFFCELLENDCPTIEFYVQAKTTEYFDENWTASIKKSTLSYWLWKPNPVYLFVYDEPQGNCYRMSVEDIRYQLFDKIFKTDTDSVSLAFDMSNLLLKGKDVNSHFINKIKDDKASIEQFRGQPTLKGDGYVRQLPGAPRNEHEFIQTRENIRVSLYSLIAWYTLRNDLQTAKAYCEFLTQFDPTGHYNHFEMLGQINLALGHKQTARENFEKSLWICDNDHIWPKESMDILKKKIKQLIEQCS